MIMALVAAGANPHHVTKVNIRSVIKSKPFRVTCYLIVQKGSTCMAILTNDHTKRLIRKYQDGMQTILLF